MADSNKMKRKMKDKAANRVKEASDTSDSTK